MFDDLFDYYPPGWPACPGCGRPAMDGHITCGRSECDEARRRRLRDEQYRRERSNDAREQPSHRE